MKECYLTLNIRPTVCGEPVVLRSVSLWSASRLEVSQCEWPDVLELVAVPEHSTVSYITVLGAFLLSVYKCALHI